MFTRVIMVKIKLISLLLFCSTLVCGQSVFQKVYPGGAFVDPVLSILQDNDQGFFSLGKITAPAGDHDLYLFKTDSLGNPLWAKTYGGTGNEFAGVIRKVSTGGHIIGGSTTSFGAGDRDFYLIRTNSLGDTLWTKAFGGSGYDQCNSVLEDSDGGFIVAGESYSFGVSGADIFLIKTDNSGNILWTLISGGATHDYCIYTQKTSDGGTIVLGHTYSYGAGDYDIYLLKINASGTILWSKTLGTIEREIATAAQETQDGGFIITGDIINLTSSGRDLFLIKTDSLGNHSWSSRINVNGNSSGGLVSWSDTKGTSVLEAEDGSYVVAGNRDTMSGPGQDFFLIKTDSAGNILKAKVYNEGEPYFKIAGSMIQTNDGGFLGSARSLGPVNTFLVKTDSDLQSGCFEYDVITATSSLPLIMNTPVFLSATGGISGYTNSIVTPVTFGSTDVCLSTGEIENSENQFLLYPNPASSLLFYKTSLLPGETADISILDLAGRELARRKILSVNKEECFDLSPLANGIYLIKITTNKGFVRTEKLVIKK